MVKAQTFTGPGKPKERIFSTPTTLMQTGCIMVYVNCELSEWTEQLHISVNAKRTINDLKIGIFIKIL